jgi:hypothetical protein
LAQQWNKDDKDGDDAIKNGMKWIERKEWKEKVTLL